MNNNFSENLKKIRKEHKLSQEQLAEELGVSRQAISKWESSQAYPEMEKIIAICDKFNVNIDDLLHKDIKKVKEDSKRNLNKYIDNFLKFITDTINLFFNMTFKCKIKFLFEQVVIIGILFILSLIVYGITDSILAGVFQFLPYGIYNIFTTIIENIITLVLIIISLIILIHIFKIRYLNYYSEFKNKNNNSNSNDNSNNKNLQEEKVIFNNQNKIIIRDPKHSDYIFINGLLKILINIIKLFSFFILLFLSFVLLVILFSFVLSFLLYKTGMFFIGLLGITLSSAIIDIIFILIIINFIFNRKNNKKKVIWSFIISLIVLGISLGLVFIGSLKFDVISIPDNLLKNETVQYEMEEGLSFDVDNIEYIESDIDNIKIEYKVFKFCDVSYIKHNTNKISIYVDGTNPIKIINAFIVNLNNKKILDMNDVIKDVKIYASNENIQILKSNSINNF